MITLKEWMELCDYRITEGSDYYFEAYGNKSYSLSHWNGDQDGYSMNIVFEFDTQKVFEVEVCDYKNNRAYRMINPDYANKGQDSEAWDDVKWTDLEVDDDFIQKALAIKDGTEYDTRVSIPLDLPKEELFNLMQLAHKKDITLNELVEEALRDAIENFELDPEGMKAKWKEFNDRRKN